MKPVSLFCPKCRAVVRELRAAGVPASGLALARGLEGPDHIPGCPDGGKQRGFMGMVVETYWLPPGVEEEDVAC